MTTRPVAEAAHLSFADLTAIHAFSNVVNVMELDRAAKTVRIQVSPVGVSKFSYFGSLDFQHTENPLSGSKDADLQGLLLQNPWGHDSWSLSKSTPGQ